MYLAISISRDEWNEGKTKDALVTQLLGVLSRDKNKAWNPEGIREELFGEETNVVEKDCQIDNIHRILLRLVEEGTVEAKQIEMEGGELEFFYVLK